MATTDYDSTVYPYRRKFIATLQRARESAQEAADTTKDPQAVRHALYYRDALDRQIAECIARWQEQDRREAAERRGTNETAGAGRGRDQ